MGTGILALAAIGGSLYLFVKNMNSESKDKKSDTSDFSEIDKYDWIIKKFATIYTIPWLELKAHIGAATNYGRLGQYLSKQEWGQNRLGIAGMRLVDFNYVTSIVKSGLRPEDRISEMVAIEFAAAFMKIIYAKYSSHNDKVIAFYLGIDKENFAETGDLFSVAEYLARYNSEYSKLLQRQKE